MLAKGSRHLSGQISQDAINPNYIDDCQHLLFILGLRRMPLAGNIAIVFVGQVFVTGLGALFLAEQVGWQTSGLTDLSLLTLAGVLLCAAHIFLIETFRFAEAALVAPFRYSALLWAGAIGFLVWGDIPDHWALLGAAMLITSGLYQFYRERKQSIVLVL